MPSRATPKQLWHAKSMKRDDMGWNELPRRVPGLGWWWGGWKLEVHAPISMNPSPMALPRQSEETDR